LDKNLAFLIHLQNSLKEDSNTSLEDAIGEFKKEYPRFTIINKDIIVMQLYRGIVIPWESLKRKLPKKIMMSDLDTSVWGNYKILDYDPRHSINKMDLRFFIRKLRNAISHNKIKILDDHSVIFRDREGTKIKYEWKELLKLLEQLTNTP